MLRGQGSRIPERVDAVWNQHHVGPALCDQRAQRGLEGIRFEFGGCGLDGDDFIDSREAQADTCRSGAGPRAATLTSSPGRRKGCAADMSSSEGLEFAAPAVPQ